MLRYTDLAVWEIGERMNFANPSFFFKIFPERNGHDTR